MKTSTVGSFCSITMLAGLMPLAVLPAVAQDPGFYFTGGVGPAIAQDIDVKQFLGGGSGLDVQLDTGYSFVVAGGYNFTPWLGVEMESGVIGNNIDRIGSSSPDAALTHIPFLANIVLRYEQDSFPLVPYLSVGAGGDSSILWIDDSLGVDGSDSDLVFAVHVTTGVRYKINETMSAGLSYKFYHAGDPSWEVDNSSGKIHFGDASVHVIAAVFNMKF